MEWVLGPSRNSDGNGLRATFDVLHKQEQDLLTTMGLLQALRDVMRLSPKGLLWGAVPCCSLLRQHIFKGMCQAGLR